MKHILLPAFALALASLWGCSRNEIEPAQSVEEARTLTFHAATETPARAEADTRSTLDTDASGIFRWQTGDRIGVFAGSGISAMDLASGAGETAATFTGSVSGTPKSVAVFPYNAGHTLASTGKANFYLPTEYTYEAGRTNAAMAATNVTIDGNALTGSFKHLGGLLQFTVSSIPSGARAFQFVADGRKVSGSFGFVTSVEEPEITTTDATEGNYVQINFAAADYASTMDFYVPVPTGTYSSFSVRLLDSDGNVIAQRKAVRSISVARADVLRMSLTMNAVPSGQVLVSAVTKRSFVYLKDGKANYVYQGTTGTVPAVGDYITLSGGSETTYNSMSQLQYATVTVKSSDNSVSYPIPVDITENFGSYTNTEMEFVTVTGTVSINNDYVNFKVDGSTSVTGSFTYPLDELNLTALNKKKVKITGYYAGISANGKYKYIVAVAVEEAVDSTEPAVVTTGADNITMTSATLTAGFSNLPLSPYAPTEPRFVYGKSPDNLDATAYYNGGITTASGSYSVDISSLDEDTCYYYKAVVSVRDADSGKYVDVEGEVKSFYTRSAASGGNTGLQYLTCYEVPQVDLQNNNGYTGSGRENWGSTNWYRYATTNSYQHVITHTYESSADRVVRNYTVLYDTDKVCPVWVATAFNTGMYPDNDLGRVGSWTYDPAISSNYQSTGGISGYDRGHLCASNDRQDTYYANCETFYYTNQAPQWASFNQGIWVNDLELEIAGLGTSGRDTLYVVSGVLFNDSDNRMTSSNNKSVLVPSHFYKCLMLCTFDGTGAVASAKGAAYMFTNGDHSGQKLSKFETTIDAVEESSGFNFFCNVPAGIQDAAEATVTRLWSYN